MIKRGIVVLLVALALAGLAPRSAHAAGIRVIGDTSIQNQFPDALVFTIEAESDADITDIRIRYTFIPDKLSSSAQPQFDKGPHVKATFTLRSGTRQIYIPPGKTIRYSWEFRDAAGNELRTDEHETSFADTRFQWQQVTDGIVNLNYYRGTQRDSEVMAQVANETITKAAALMGVKFDFPVKIWAYGSQVDFQIALAHESVTHDPGVLGQAHEPDTFIMVVDRLSSPTALDTARHELTHLVTANALRGGPFKDLYPSWLNEGTSVYFQVSPNDVGYIDSLEQAVRDDQVIPLRSLTSGTRSRDIGLFYGEGYSVVKYLIATYGPEKFAAMIAEFKRNGDLDSTFKKVFGVDVDGLYRDWRVSQGLPAEQPKNKAPADQRGSASSAGSDSGTVALVIGASVLMVLLAGTAVAGGLLLARRVRAGDGE